MRKILINCCECRYPLAECFIEGEIPKIFYQMYCSHCQYSFIRMAELLGKKIDKNVGYLHKDDAQQDTIVGNTNKHYWWQNVKAFCDEMEERFRGAPK